MLLCDAGRCRHIRTPLCQTELVLASCAHARSCEAPNPRVRDVLPDLRTRVPRISGFGIRVQVVLPVKA